MSEEAKDFIRHLIAVDPKSRMTAEQCLEHPWLQKLVASREIAHRMYTMTPKLHMSTLLS